MAAYFVDTSALVRRDDRREPGAPHVRAITAPGAGHLLLIGRITPIEVASALSRKTREGVLTASRRDALWRVFSHHWRRQYRTVMLDEAILAQAGRLVRTHPLKAYDAVQLASALHVAGLLAGDLRFLTGDTAQAAAAAAEGLSVEVAADPPPT